MGHPGTRQSAPREIAAAVNAGPGGPCAHEALSARSEVRSGGKFMYMYINLKIDFEVSVCKNNLSIFFICERMILDH